MQHPKNRYLGTIAQLCPAISWQLMHVSTIGKNLGALLHGTCTPVLASVKLCGVKQAAPPTYDRAAIMLGIGSHSSFWATVCKTVHPMLSDRCLSVCLSCPVCDVGALWPNGWMDQDETWHAHIRCSQMAAWIKISVDMKVGLGPGDFVLDGDPAPPPPKEHSPQFSAHFYCGQTA